MIGKGILNYVIISTIGKGGMGSVYLAEHKYIKQQKVAIKVINSDMVNDFTRNMLKKEAELLASLNHPNIVHFHDYHIDESGDIYLIMEYADGVNLEEYIRSISGLIVEDKICPLFEPILDAVGYAHTRHMIHRDIKPANIIITKEGIPKILDFGIAKIISQRESEDDNLIMGTPSYMSPEQVKGEKLDGRSDIYSLGVLLHQMMTGNPPYDTTTIPERDINRKVVEEPLPRMRSYYKFVSEKVQKVVDKATAKNRNDRYQTCAEFKKALHNAIYPPKVPIWGWISAAIITLLIVGGGLYYWDYNREKVYYYKDYVEQWGIPKGIHELSAKEQANRVYSYRFIQKRRKLQRMSYINSKGNIVNHNNTDDIDRMADAFFYYREDGTMNSVKVCDQFGKVLYVKDYNYVKDDNSERKHVAIFKYDDGLGTEKNLSSNTIGTFTSTFADNDSRRSNISRYIIYYDPNGYTKKIEYAAFQNARTSDNDGIWGKTFKVDDKGRIIEETFIGHDGNPKAIKSGMAIRTREFNDEDDAIRFTYLTVNREPSGETGLNIPVCHNIVDKWGNTIKQRCEDMDGNLMLRSDYGIAGFDFKIENGVQIEQWFIGIDGNRCYDKENKIAGGIYQFDENGYQSSVIYGDVNGKPMQANDGTYGMLTKCDNKGNVIWLANINKDHKYIKRANDNYSILRRKYDERGNVLEVACYDEHDSLVNTNNGSAIIEYQYDSQDKIISQKYLDKGRKPVRDENGVIYYKCTYSLQGNLEKISYYDGTGQKLMLSYENIAGWKSVFDENGNETERSFFNEKEQLCRVNGRYAKWTAKYDEKGNQIDIRYHDVDGKFTSFENTAVGFDYKYDERGNIIETKPIGMDEALAKNRFITKSIYDKFDNIKEEAFYNEKGATINTLGYHKSICEYNSRNQQIEIRYYDTKGNLTTYNKDKYAIQKDEFDAKGLRTHCYFYGVDGKPVICKEGWASSTYEYNVLGQLVRQLFFDVNQKPTNPKVMVPEGLCKYDKWGNMVYVAAGDGNGNLIMNPQFGWSVLRKEFNIRGQVLYEAYYNDSDKPLICTEGYHKVIYGYDKNGNQTSIAWFGTAQEPISQYGVHKQVYIYNDNSQVTEWTLYGKKEEPINCNAGFQRIEYKYKDNKTKESYQRKLYKANGGLLDTQNWDGSQWVSTKAVVPINSTPPANDWQQSIRTLNSALPMDLGKEQNHLVMLSFKVTGKNSCELVFKAPKSKYTLAEAELESYLKNIKIAMSKFKSEYLPSNVVIIGVLKDSKERILNTIKM